jgi:hypothetical protein
MMLSSTVVDHGLLDAVDLGHECPLKDDAALLVALKVNDQMAR